MPSSAIPSHPRHEALPCRPPVKASESRRSRLTEKRSACQSINSLLALSLPIQLARLGSTRRDFARLASHRIESRLTRRFPTGLPSTFFAPLTRVFPTARLARALAFLQRRGLNHQVSLINRLFSARASFLAASSLIDLCLGCYFEKSGASGNIRSSEMPEEVFNYSETYKTPLECIWNITVQPGWKVIKRHFQSSGSSCSPLLFRCI